jgi:hypothetical protein
LTPLERPEALGDKAFITEDELPAFLQQIRLPLGGTAASIVEGNEPGAPRLGVGPEWLEYGSALLPTLQTSIIVDPANGRFPPLTPKAQQMLEAQSRWVRPIRRRLAPETPLRGPEDWGLSERCLLGIQSGPPFTPSVEGNYVQFFQTEGHFVIHTELNHEARVVPLDGRPHLPDSIRQWQGDPRGHWDGDTLVVESTNFSDKTGSWNDTFQSYGSGLTLHLAERFTRINNDTLLYEWTVNDPETFTAPFTGSQPLRRTDASTFEFHCHEGNRDIVLNALRGARAAEGEDAP